MKRILFYILILFSIAYPMSAQECVLCGDWVGETTFKDVMDGSKTTIKRTVRIKQEEGTYSIGTIDGNKCTLNILSATKYK